ncbi:MAG: Transcriptional regulator, HxlR family [Subtercola sp.]|jgi:DNA-binding HxlR family transcriptional regulator|nr:Transcriptional regulator, HxlR family [Subtercola sp.]
MSNSTMGRCGEDALKLVADYWVLRIVEELNRAGEPLRFCNLQRLLDGVSPVTLTARLRALDDRALVARTEGSAGKASVSYELTDRGRAVLPVIQAISDFATSSP